MTSPSPTQTAVLKNVTFSFRPIKIVGFFVRAVPWVFRFDKGFCCKALKMKVSVSDAALMMIATAIVICSPILPLFMQARPQVGDIALVVASPWGDAAWIANKAGVQEVAPERAPLGVLVALESPESVSQLYAHGAWLVIDGERALEICAI